MLPSLFVIESFRKGVPVRTGARGILDSLAGARDVRYAKDMRKMIALLSVTLSATLISCSHAPSKPESSVTQANQDHLIAATLWYQTAGEARAAALQAYELARIRLDDILSERKPGAKKAAVVVDVDETVLDNSPYQARMIRDGFAYPKGWTEWVKEARAEAIPGALEFLKYAASKGVDVFYVTNRKDEEKEATIRNLKRLGFPNSTERFVMTRSKESSKEPRRNEIEKTHEIVLLAGDNLNDFTDDFEKKNVRQRMSAVDRLEKQDLWGRKFIVLPNPMYGDWEGAVYNYNWGSSAQEKDRIRRKSLKTRD